MSDNLKEALQDAYIAKKGNMNTFIWKGPKKTGQKEVNLMDASPQELKGFYSHCISMLYSTDKEYPGRYVLKEQVYDQINKCNTELFLRWLENKYLVNPERKKYPRNLIFQDLRIFLNNNSSFYPKEKWNEISIGATIQNVPEEFRDVTIENVLDGCLDRLGLFNKKHLTLNFIARMGVWLTPQEMRELTEPGKTRVEIIKERLRLKPYINIHINNKGISYNELRSMVTLKSKKYSDMTNLQLLTLKNKILFRFCDELDSHIYQWKERMREIQMVAAKRKIEIDDKN